MRHVRELSGVGLVAWHELAGVVSLAVTHVEGDLRPHAHSFARHSCYAAAVVSLEASEDLCLIRFAL